MSDPFRVVRDFEAALCEYTGAPYSVTTTSCTDALKLAVAWHIKEARRTGKWTPPMPPDVQIPRRTYVGVAQSIVHAGGRPTFRDEEWLGIYPLRPLPVWDSARWLTSGMYSGPVQLGGINRKAATAKTGTMVCLSFHWSKTLGIQQGGAILHDNPEADRWLRMARFDGRQEGIDPKDQKEWIVGHHCYMAPETAAAGIKRLSHLPMHNEPLPNDDYPDLSQIDIFK